MAESIIRSYAALPVEWAVPLVDRDYYGFLLTSVNNARKRVWVSMFIINALVAQDPDRRVRTLLRSLIDKQAIGLDVRVIVELSKQNPAIRCANEATLTYLSRKGVPARPYRGRKASMHSKYVLIDEDLVILGSHNWTSSAFSHNIEDSVALASLANANVLATDFLTAWVAS